MKTLTLLDRIVLLNLEVLPFFGNYSELSTKKKIVEKIDFSQDELQDYQIEVLLSTIVNGKLKRQKKDIFDFVYNNNFNYVFSEPEQKFIEQCLKQIDSQNKLTDYHLNLYETFVINNL